MRLRTFQKSVASLLRILSRRHGIYVTDNIQNSPKQKLFVKKFPRPYDSKTKTKNILSHSLTQ